MSALGVEAHKPVYGTVGEQNTSIVKVGDVNPLEQSIGHPL